MARKRRWVLDSEKEEMWRMWKSGTPVLTENSICLILGRASGRRGVAFQPSSMFDGAWSVRSRPDDPAVNDWRQRHPGRRVLQTAGDRAQAARAYRW